MLDCAMSEFSGREDLPVVDRIGLLVYDKLWLEGLPGDAAMVHDRANLVAMISMMRDCSELGILSHIVERELSTAECLVMAWRRGGHQEYRRIRESFRSS